MLTKFCTSRIGHLHEPIVALIKVLLCQTNLYRKDDVAIQSANLDPGGVAVGTSFMNDITLSRGGD